MTAATGAKTLPPQALWLLAGLTLGWGFNWPVMKVALTEMAPLHFRTWCLLAGAAIVFGIALAWRRPLAVPRGAWGRLVLISFLNMSVWNILVVYGLSMMASGRASILGYTMPVWAVIFGTWLLREPFTPRRAVGVTLGMAGMALLLGAQIEQVQGAPLGAMLLLGAAISWALGTVIMKRWPIAMLPSPLIAWQMLIGGVPVFLGALLFEPHGSFAFWEVSLWPALGVVYNMVIAFGFCSWAWIKIALMAPVGVASLSTLLIPVVGVFSAALTLGEVPKWQDYAALALVFAALATVLPLPWTVRTTGR